MKVELKDDLLLWRYMSVPRFLGLSGDRLYFPNLLNARKLNDPLESMQIAEAQDVIAALVQQGGNPQTLNRDIEEAITEYVPTWMKASLLDKNLSSASRSDHLAHGFQEYMATRRAVSCWYSGSHESAGMWKAFAESGVAVTIRLANLERAMPTDRAFSVSAVHYFDREETFALGSSWEYPEIVLRPYLVKGLEYAHENEVRIVTHCPIGEEGVSIIAPILGVAETIFISPYLNHPDAAALSKCIEDIIKARAQDAGQRPVVLASSIFSRKFREWALFSDFKTTLGDDKSGDMFPL